ncbi:MAG: hypothetical protein QG577_2603 [Thermodesulfobacteriota bacterium]|nr:hypothetical protein [Thermodesulfobacteriota bacterium]
MEAIENRRQSEKDIAVEYRIVLPDGKVRWISSIGRTQRNSAKGPNRLMGVSVDITHRKESELVAARQREELSRASRVASLSELSGALAHQINQPLTAILSNAQAAARHLSHGTPDLEEVCETISDIIADDKRARDIIRRLRALLRRGELDLVSVNLNEIVRETAGLAKDIARLRDISLVLDLQEDLPPVDGDTLHMQQVILNLIMNGIEAMEGCEPESRKIRISTERHDPDTIKVSVQDKGTGIDEACREIIFQPFQTSKTDGLGIGLSICRSIVLAHDGRLWGENCPEGGAVFSFTIPIRRGVE